VLLLAVPFKVISPEDWLIVLDAALNGANPVVLAELMCGPDMTRHATLVSKSLAANWNLATVARCAIVLRARRCFNRGCALGFLLDFLPRMDGIE